MERKEIEKAFGEENKVLKRRNKGREKKQGKEKARGGQ